jgi:hypothetical protein
VSSRRTKKTKKTQKPERDYTGDARDNWRRRGRRENSIDRNSSETFVVCYVLKKSIAYLRVVDELAVPVPGGDGHGFFFF